MDIDSHPTPTPPAEGEVSQDVEVVLAADLRAGDRVVMDGDVVVVESVMRSGDVAAAREVLGAHLDGARARLSLEMQRQLVERSVETLDAMPSEVLDHVLDHGSPRRRTLLTRMRRNPAALAA